MSQSNNVSMSTIRRLPRYYRFLGKLIQNNIYKISSKKLSEMLGVTASQIRQDLHCFGEFGQQGYGYNVSALYKEIQDILGVSHKTDAILIGAGNLGKAILSYMNFNDKGFNLIGVFDKNVDLIDKDIAGYNVLNISNLKSFCAKNSPKVAILCIPQESAENLAKTLVESGIRGFWNFSHYDFAINFDDVIVENVHISDSLLTLCFQINKSN